MSYSLGFIMQTVCLNMCKGTSAHSDDVLISTAAWLFPLLSWWLIFQFVYARALPSLVAKSPSVLILSIPSHIDSPFTGIRVTIKSFSASFIGFNWFGIVRIKISAYSTKLFVPKHGLWLVMWFVKTAKELSLVSVSTNFAVARWYGGTRLELCAAEFGGHRQSRNPAAMGGKTGSRQSTFRKVRQDRQHLRQDNSAGNLFTDN